MSPEQSARHGSAVCAVMVIFVVFLLAFTMNNSWCLISIIEQMSRNFMTKLLSPFRVIIGRRFSSQKRITKQQQLQKVRLYHGYSLGALYPSSELQIFQQSHSFCCYHLSVFLCIKAFSSRLIKTMACRSRDIKNICCLSFHCSTSSRQRLLALIFYINSQNQLFPEYMSFSLKIAPSSLVLRNALSSFSELILYLYRQQQAYLNNNIFKL